MSTCRFKNKDIPQASRVEAPGGVAGRSRAGMFANRIVRLRTYPSSLSPRASKSRCWNVFPEAQTSEILCKPSCRIQNPDILRAGRVGAPSGAAGRGRAMFSANRTIRSGNKGSLCPSKHRIEETSFQRSSRRKIQRNSM